MSDNKLEVETGVIRKVQHFSIWLISILVIALGVYLTMIEFCNIEWLTRSGCIVVMLGIWSGMGGIIEEGLLSSRLDVQRRIALSRAKVKLRKIAAPEEYAEKELESIESDHERKVEDLRNKFRLQLGILEVSLLLTGTFIWGFGDLLFKLSF
ncbi:hypothetical protein GCM10008107_22200 [Psychrosphaera saromensis]|uniref:DUF3899 domain-containing protein n=1 Tax=Psychrosphaera saromensis TaxID=716813 RepID=A0A2S7UQL1_9GAMM|nr:hypothetical protein [Psychrosphaera saromensis]PQJ52274.1 hypothetical protein BTO11_00440 [Psychrosphaera saromensis]GHB72391.1 hypothetical protein GCM10008107_22200 [Psychrosphaera saromensis]GLQ13576.1 hypothetical protein GCM10007917_10310 [Psychrosphaera saromensis]